MQPETFLTKQEIKTRKTWLLISLILFGFSLFVMGISTVLSYNYQPKELTANYISFFIQTIYLTITYQLCYKKHTTFLLTLQLIGYGLVLLLMLIAPINMFSKQGIAYGLGGMIGASIVFLPCLYVFVVTRRMRTINKILKCLNTFPNESSELIQAFQNAAAIKDLDSLFEKYQSTPRLLRYLAIRQKNLREQELKSA